MKPSYNVDKMGTCTCYLGQNDTLCKHMVAVVIRVVTNGNPLTEADKETCFGWEEPLLTLSKKE